MPNFGSSSTAFDELWRASSNLLFDSGFLRGRVVAHDFQRRRRQCHREHLGRTPMSRRRAPCGLRSQLRRGGQDLVLVGGARPSTLVMTLPVTACVAFDRNRVAIASAIDRTRQRPRPVPA